MRPVNILAGLHSRLTVTKVVFESERIIKNVIVMAINSNKGCF